MVPKKRCLTCGAEKPANIKYFEVCHQNEDNLRDWCLDCGKEKARVASRAHNKEWRSKNPEQARLWARGNRASNPKRCFLNHAKSSSKVRGITFDLTIKDIPDIPEVCPVFGFPLVINVGGGKQSFNSPSLDRIDSTKGYVPGNLQIISWRANQLKRDGTLEEFEMLVAHLRSIQKARN
jgi:hypothetical protein